MKEKLVLIGNGMTSWVLYLAHRVKGRKMWEKLSAAVSALAVILCARK